jgi:hypothetical protein
MLEVQLACLAALGTTRILVLPQADHIVASKAYSNIVGALEDLQEPMLEGTQECGRRYQEQGSVVDGNCALCRIQHSVPVK